jgi:LysR family hydrogen peroxide-inducible transcriptional activator
MELFQLRYFEAAARLLNFSRAAEACHISQPSLSLQIANLEKEVGAPLFVRQGRVVRLTDAGATLSEYAERMLALEDEARRSVRAIVGLERGRLSLWTLPTPGQHLLPPALARFRAAHPKIEITVREATPARVIGEAIAAGKADIGIVQFPCRVPGLLARELLTEELVALAPERHPLATRKRPPCLADLAAEDFVWVPDGDSAEHPIYAACLAAGFTPKIACTSGSAGGMQALVAAGLGIALLPRLAVHPPESVRVIPLAPDPDSGVVPTRTLAAVWRADGPLTHPAEAFLELLTGP